MGEVVVVVVVVGGGGILKWALSEAMFREGFKQKKRNLPLSPLDTR